MHSELPKIEACFSPSEFHQYEKGFELIVVIDVLRATSAICAAIENGVKGIIPVEKDISQLQNGRAKLWRASQWGIHPFHF